MDGQNYLAVKETFNGFLEGHTGAISSIVSGFSTGDGRDSNILVSGSRDKSILIWKLNPDQERQESEFYGEPYIAFTGHNHFVSDLSLSTDNNFLISSSWDSSLRLWNLKNGKCIKRFSLNNNKEIFSTTFAHENRQIFSCGSDNKISLWNTQGKFILDSSYQKSGHNDWVSKVRNSPSAKNSFYASVGWDGRLKIWTDFFKMATSIKAHEGPINALAISTNGLFIATGGKDQTVKLWKVSDMQEPLVTYKCDSPVQDVSFNPELQWVAAATEKSVKVWDVAGESETPIANILPKERATKIQGQPRFTTVAWSSSGKNLFCGATDGLIRVHNVVVDPES